MSLVLSRGKAHSLVRYHLFPSRSVVANAPMLPSKPSAMYPMSAEGSDHEVDYGCQLTRMSQNHDDVNTTGPL